MSITLHSSSGSLTGHIRLSGSKSISNRLLILQALSGQQFAIQNLSDAEDTQLLKAALQHIASKQIRTIDVNHAGTDFRFLTALLSVTPGEWTLTGSSRMKQRPIGELVRALQSLGAEIRYLEQEGFPPLQIHGKTLNGGAVTVRGDISSQFISALLLIAPAMKKGLDLRIEGDIVSWPYIQMTLAMLAQFDVKPQVQNQHIVIHHSPLQLPGALAYSVESDWSSTSYWYSLAALSESADLVIDSLNSSSVQADRILTEIYQSFGVQTSFTTTGIRLQKTGAPVSTFHYDFKACPDIAQTIAVTCLGLGIKARLTGLSTLKFKETDRIHALKQELEKFDARVIATGESLEITPPANGLRASHEAVYTYHDHRMAMSFAPLCLKTKQITIDDQYVVDKSYPQFWHDLTQSGFHIEP